MVRVFEVTNKQKREALKDILIENYPVTTIIRILLFEKMLDYMRRRTYIRGR